MEIATAIPSTKPYLLRAIYEWCADNSYTPYIAVAVDDTVHVPMQYVKNNEIILNISFDATSNLKLANESIEFKARFAGVAREIYVPLERVLAIYALENGQGMAFPVEPPISSAGPVRRMGAHRPVPVGGSSAAGVAPGPEAKGLSVVEDRTPVGLRSVPSAPVADAPSNVVSLTTAPATADAVGADEEPPPKPTGAGGGRPALKRIK
jgi:stringent starvation protein B